MKHIIFYDAQCPLCANVKKVLIKLDWFQRLEWVPVQKAEDEAQYHYLKERDVYDRIHMMSASGRLYAGFYSVRRILRALPATALFGWLLYIPKVDRLGVPLYNWISANRHDWFGRYAAPVY
ncbi:thiol-disulfide oxidoreductase DCC family protein [Priestia koreensis]|uniref:thiol-disulfide oxidoreductase DCC family protein n=1 Tax=Priestia koreensis TaxID=284581 RepID=UPI001F5AD7D3|nr:DUF393 domain-containing protein [Priestia koreensis]UNL83687.1 DUF393 domain-containing protein [Priestia koreensis]